MFNICFNICLNFFSQVRDGQKAFLVRAKINGLANLGKYQGDGKATGAAGESLFVANHQY